MTTTDVRVADDIDPAGEQPDRHRRYGRSALVVVLVVLLVSALGYLVGNEVQANTQFDQAHRSLDVTRGRIHGVDADLTAVRRQLAGLQGQVKQDTAALAADTAKLNGVKVALANSQANVSRQNSAIGSLYTCLGGVEEALNALSLGDQKHGLAALDAVAASCRSAESADG
jgi:septal ring factor EnvC (AmiA/AmiB activator)